MRDRGPASSGLASWTPDLVAGLAVWAVLVPESLAYARVAGVEPSVGLVAAPAALLLYAVLGSSRTLVVGPMSATAALSAVAVAPVVAGGAGIVTATSALALLVGLVCLVAGLLRLGFVASAVSEPVLRGFVVGVALTILVGQVPALLGLDSTGGEGFAERLLALVSGPGSLDPLSATIGLGALAALTALHRLAPRAPSAVAVVLAAAALSWAADLTSRGVAVVGDIDRGLGAWGVPSTDVDLYADLAVAAVAIALVAFVEGLGAARSAPGSAEVRPDRELVATGAANLGAALSGGMVVNGSLSKTAVAVAAGARSRRTSVVAGVLTLATVLVLAPVFGPLPEPVLAAVVVHAVMALADPRRVLGLSRFPGGPAAGPRHRGAALRPDLWAGLAALAGVLLLGTLAGLGVGVAASAALLALRVSRPAVTELGLLTDVAGRPAWVDLHRHPGATSVDGVTVLRVEGPLFYASSDAVRSRLRSTRTAALVIDAAGVGFVDVQAALMLAELAAERRRDGGRTSVARATGQVRDMLQVAREDTGSPLDLTSTIEASPGTEEAGSTGGGREQA